MNAISSHAEAALEELHTAADFVRWAASRFNEAELCFGHGTDNAVDEARALVLHALHLEPDAPDGLLRGRLTRFEKQQVLELLVRRVRERIPAAYLTHRAWFAGLAFYVDERVLVPRSPIGEWIERGFAPWVDATRVKRILDLGTGSGCLAIACALAFPEVEVDAADISADALEVARINIRAHGLAPRVHPLRSDLFDEMKGTYDLIVSNPPYVDATELAAMPPEYRHEPTVGLSGGRDGLQCLRRILSGAGSHLAPNGVLVMEVGASRPALERAFPQAPFLWLELERGGENVLLLTAEELGALAGSVRQGG